MKILHTADWHLDAPLAGHSAALRQALAAVPGKLFELCKAESCDLVLIAGDVFDGAYTPNSYQNLRDVLRAMAVPVFISPGNHDYCAPESPWMKELWPENVHIFKKNTVESVAVPALDLRVYGAGFTGMDCTALLTNFRAECPERYAIGIFHGDPTQTASPYNPITANQVQESGLDYLALGHIHKAGQFTAGQTVCAWPGCPMGRGYDEAGQKGAYIVDTDDWRVRFVPMDAPRFYDLEGTPDALSALLPPAASEDYYRVTLTGPCEEPDLNAIGAAFAHLPNLTLRDRTTRPLDVWGNAGEDSFEGVYFGMLRQAHDTADGEQKQALLLAAELSRQILNGQEVVLP